MHDHAHNEYREFGREQKMKTTTQCNAMPTTSTNINDDQQHWNSTNRFTKALFHGNRKTQERKR
jgi:hypothetical protein